MIYVDHDLSPRALCTFNTIGMPWASLSRDLTRLDSIRIVVNFAEQVTSAISYCLVAYRVLASSERPVNQQSQSPGQACMIKLDCAI